MESIRPGRQIKPVLYTALVLLAIQAARTAAIYGVSKATGTDITTLDLASTCSFLILGVLLWLIFQPDRQMLGLTLSQTPKWGRILSLVLLVLAAGAIVSGAAIAGFEAGILLATLHSAIVTPIYEELIFRGYIWNYLKSRFKKEITVYLVTTALFALWHLGYAMDIYLRTGGEGMANIMLMKVLIGAVFGAITGLARWKTRNTYSAILIHALMNVFGR